MLRVAENIGLGADLHRTAEIHHDDLVGHVLHDRKIVADEEIGEPHPLLQLHQQVQDLALDREIQRRHRLVQHQHLRIEHQRARHRDPLPLSAREHVRIALVMLGAQAGQAQHLARLRGALRPSHGRTVDLQRLLEDRADLLARVERAVGILEHDLHRRAQAGPVVFRRGRSVEAEMPRRRLLDQRHHPRERRLPAPTFAHHGQRLAGVKREARLLQRLHRLRLGKQPAPDLVEPREPFGDDHRRGHASASAGTFSG